MERKRKRQRQISEYFFVALYLYCAFTPDSPFAMYFVSFPCPFPTDWYIIQKSKSKRRLFPHNHPPPLPLPSSITFPLTSLALTPPLGKIPPSLTSTPLRLTTLPVPPIPPPVLPIPPHALAFPSPTVPDPQLPCPPEFPVRGVKARCSGFCRRFCCWSGGVGGFISKGRGIMFSFWLVYSKGAVWERG